MKRKDSLQISRDDAELLESCFSVASRIIGRTPLLPSVNEIIDGFAEWREIRRRSGLSMHLGSYVEEWLGNVKKHSEGVYGEKPPEDTVELISSVERKLKEYEFI